jgi:DNA-binding response OmpR family regulator
MGTQDQKRTILIVEDEKALLEILKTNLEESGFKVLTTTNGVEGLEALKKHQVDLVLLDLLMPLMSGFDVLEEMGKKKIAVPVIVLSNLGQQEDVNKIKASGAKEYLIKSDTPISVVVEKIKSQF